MIRGAVLFAVALAAQAQQFDAASIRPPGEVPTRCTGGPGTQDPGRLTCENFSLAWLVMMAYNLRPFQYAAPDWTRMTRFNVQATLQPDSSADQFRAMLQHLLAERFRLAVHHERREMDGYDMVKLKKSPNLKPAASEATATGEPAWRTPMGGPPVPATAQLKGAGLSMPRLAQIVSDRLNRPVTDATGVSGRFDFVLTYSDAPPGPSVAATSDNGLDIEGALREQLGLGLVRKKIQIDIVVVDQVEKTPVEN